MHSGIKTLKPTKSARIGTMLLAATAGMTLLAGGAQADCNGQNFSGSVNPNPSVLIGPGFSAISINGGVPADAFDSGSQTDNDCYTAGSVSYGTGTAATGVLVEDPNNPGDAVYVAPITAVYGENSSAVGNGATVGKLETYTETVTVTNDNGTPGDPTDDFDEEVEVERTRLVPVNNGTAVGANSSVQHDHSTAIGADSQTDRANQVVVGTEDDEVTVRNLTTNTATKEETAGIVVHKADGTLASDGGRIQNQIDTNSNDISTNTADIAANAGSIADNAGDIRRNAEKIDDVEAATAVALAMPDAYLEANKNFAIAAGIGGTGDAQAFAGILSFRFDDTWTGYAGGGVDFEGRNGGFKGGLRAAW